MRPLSQLVCAFILFTVHIGPSSQTTKMFLSTRIFRLTLAIFVPACSISNPHLSEQDSMPQFAQFSPPISDLPVLLNLAQTFSQASLGLQKDAFQDWIKDNPLDDSMKTVRAFVVKFQEAVLNDIDRLNQTFYQDETFPHFLSQTMKFSVFSSNSFQQILYDCASLQGCLPYRMNLLHNVIDQQHVPPSIYISQKPIFRSVDASQWQKTISDSSELCSVWQINEVTEQAEIIAQPDCNRDLPSICLQSVGTKTYSNQSDHQATQQQRLASSQHLYYLLTQLSTYPSPQKRFASDISLHITEAFEIFDNFIENKTNVSYQALFASKRCIDLIQLALQKAQHSEGWKAEERQQSNFEAIQELLNNHTLFIKNMHSRFQRLETKQRQYDQLRKGGPIDDPSPPEGSGFADHFSPDHNPGRDEDDDANASNNHLGNHQANVSTHHDNAHVNVNVSNPYDNVSNHDDNPHAKVSTHHDNAHVNASNVNDTNGQSADDDDASWTFSSLFSWDFWVLKPKTTQNQTTVKTREASSSCLIPVAMKAFRHTYIVNSKWSSFGPFLVCSLWPLFICSTS